MTSDEALSTVEAAEAAAEAFLSSLDISSTIFLFKSGQVGSFTSSLVGRPGNGVKNENKVRREGEKVFLGFSLQVYGFYLFSVQSRPRLRA